ncbi:MAG: hypothetical protein FWC58_09055, partial [Desulfobulbus sp.]|nr:hypothetical protein [Desulfobulbus sp.]
MPTVTDYLKYANLQMAAEAFLKDPKTDAEYYSGIAMINALKAGNGYASKFTESEAIKFESEWVVLDQCKNTNTGFSGTLFKNKTTGELVLSFRSTEFIDDAIRDSAATNALEVHDTGWAWGQISDMEAWYAQLKKDGLIPAGSQLNVTGYSLGGHLATAFNLLHNDEFIANGTQVITFNGAGVGEIKTGTLADDLNYFNDLRTSET